jgi:CheY-like chemotaxis protein/anti-sigma regulatory factor (Ser/Thr protein kinase)
MVERILIVDDDRSTRHLIRLQLRSAGYGVETAKDGAEALALVRRKKFDLVLLDVWMPGMDGLEMLARLRDEPSQPKVVVMTSDENSETLLRAIQEHAYRYVTKPVEPKQLLELVRAVLAAGPELRPIEVLSARPDWVELAVPCDREAAERIQEFMARLEADLPEDVRANVGQAFRELLMNAIEWGGGLDPRPTVRISYLRARRMLLYRIADPGQGFSFQGLTHAAVNNPPDNPVEHMSVRAEKGLRPGGFGLVLTRAMVDELLYNEKQNEVVFVKYLD